MWYVLLRDLYCSHNVCGSYDLPCSCDCDLFVHMICVLFTWAMLVIRNGLGGREDLKQDGETILSATWVLRG